MLQEAMPPITRVQPLGGISRAERQEAFAYAQLAGYAGSVAGRSMISFLRAYGADLIVQFPRSGDGTPGWIVALYTTPRIAHIIVAIEGMSSLSQITGWNHSFTSFAIDGFPGRVFAPFATYADNIRTRLYANEQFRDATTRRQYRITFTGFSMGAAIAEILGERYVKDAPGVPVKVVKYAAPRVGNRAWNEGRSELVDRTNEYVGNDPIHLYPIPMFASYQTFAGTVTTSALTWFERDRLASRFTYNPIQSRLSFPDQSQLDALRILAGYSDVVGPTTLWGQHAPNFYRYVYNTEQNIWGQDLNSFRFGYLEFPDENKFQTVFHADGGYNNSDFGLLDPPPAPQGVPLALDPRDGAEGGGGDLDDLDLNAAVRMEEEGAWGQVAAPAVLTRRSRR